MRNVEKAREVLGANAKTAVAELTDRAALERVLQGLDSVFVVSGHDAQIGEQQNNVIDAALQAGVKYLVRVSASRAVASPNSETLVGRAHHAVDERLRNSKLGWVILRPGLFMQNVLGQAEAIRNDNKIVMPYAKDFPLAMIDVRDTGAAHASSSIQRRTSAKPTSSPARPPIMAPLPTCFRKCWGGRSLISR